MIRRTFGQVSAQLAATAGQTGMPVTAQLLLDYVNNAIQELANEGDWPGVVDRWHFAFNQTTAEVTLPYHLERLIDVTVDDVPLEIRSPWYEFVQYGPGIQRERTIHQDNCRRGWVNVVMERGEQPTRITLPVIGGPWQLRVSSQVNEDPTATINLQGSDADGLFIRTQSITDGTAGDWQNGVNLSIGTSSVTTTEEFSTLDAVVKPVTNGYVSLSAVNGSVVVPLSDYAFVETAPVYRKYFIPHLYRCNTTDYRHRVILARCRRRFVPVTEANDTLMIGNVLALQEMMIAQWYRTVPDLQEYAAHKSQAVDIMRKEAMAYMGKSRTPSLTFSRGYPIGAMGYLR